MQTSGVIGPLFIVCSESVNGGKFVCLLFFVDACHETFDGSSSCAC